jgi:hypothetical protein
MNPSNQLLRSTPTSHSSFNIAIATSTQLQTSSSVSSSSSSSSSSNNILANLSIFLPLLLPHLPGLTAHTGVQWNFDIHVRGWGFWMGFLVSSSFFLFVVRIGSGWGYHFLHAVRDEE